MVKAKKKKVIKKTEKTTPKKVTGSLIPKKDIPAIPIKKDEKKMDAPKVPKEVLETKLANLKVRGYDIRHHLDQLKEDENKLVNLYNQTNSEIVKLAKIIKELK